MTIIVARYCPKKLSSSNPCTGMECKEPTKIFIYGSRNRRKVLPRQQLLSGIAEKRISSNLCRVMEGKEPIKLFISPRNRRKVLPWQHLLPGIVEKLVSSNPCRGLEDKEPTKMFIYRSKKNIKCYHGVWNAKDPQKRFLNPRNMRKCCQVPTKSKFEKQYRKSIAMATAVTKNLQKSITSTLVVPLA